ncbi:MAG: LCP family protein [Egibacteraceae bacterium]
MSDALGGDALGGNALRGAGARVPTLPEIGTDHRPRTAGRRARRMAARRRSRRRRQLGTVVAASLLVVTLWAQDRGAPSVSDPGQTLLLVSRPPGSGVPASSVTLLAVGATDGEATVLFLPVGTLMELPGLGLDRLAMAYQYGGASLVEATVENAFGIDVDYTSVLEDPGLPGLLGRTGKLQLELPEPLATPGESELAVLARAELAFRAVLEALEEKGIRDGVIADGAPYLGIDPEWVASLFSRLAEASADKRVSFTLLPVQKQGDEGAYQLERDGLTTLVQRSLGGPTMGSDPTHAPEGIVRVQVLDAVGRPEVDAQVRRALGNGTFQVMLAGNARSFDLDRTQIVVFGEEAASMAAAEQVRERLGVGTIQVSRQPQRVVDLTIMVGADFRPR